MHAYLTALILVLASFASGCATVGSGGQRFDATRLQNAVDTDDAAYVQNLVQSRAISVNQRIPAEAYPDGTPLITIAARSASLNVLRYLIAAGADVNARTPVGETPLMLAVYFCGGDHHSAQGHEKHERAAHMLVEAGASLENERYSYTPLAYAAFQGHDRILRYLIDRGARVDADAENGITYVNTPLMMAAIEGQAETARFLLRAGADPRIRVVDGRTAMGLAEKYGQKEVTPVLRCAERLAPGQLFSMYCER
jgi:ankyrin repeat protein